MDEKEKTELGETDICDLFITPAIKDAGWDQLRQIRRIVAKVDQFMALCDSLKANLNIT